MTAKRSAWSAEDDAALRRIVAAGQPASVAAEATGRSRNACIGRAARIGVTFDSTPENRKPVASDWSEADIATLRRMAGEGASSLVIAEAMGRTPGAVRFRACIHKISLARRKAAPRPPKAPRPARTIADAAPRPRPVSVRAGRSKRGGEGAQVRNSCAPAILPPVPAPLPPPPDGGVAFMDLGSRHCRTPLWPNGARPALEAMFFCGGETRPGLSWCPACLPRMGSTQAALRREAEAHLAAQARARRPQRIAWGTSR